MSVSYDDETAEGGEDASAVLAGWLDDYSEGRCELADMQESFLSVCRSDPDAPWDALALLDQYTRRGRIKPELAQSLKSDIEKLVFGQGRASSGPRTGAPRAKPQKPEVRTPPPTSETIDIDVRAEAPLAKAFDRASKRTPEPDAERTVIERAERAPKRTPEPDAERTLLERPERAPERANTDLRRLAPERDADSTRPGSAFIDRTLLRGDLGGARAARATSEAQVYATPTPAPKPMVPPVRSESTGRVLRDRYELLSIIGRSASGTVYRAVDRHRAHLTHAARYVAVKVLNADLAGDPRALAELEREFHHAQSLAHPNIVSVFDLDRDGDTYFIVMEMLEGELLASLLRKLGGRPMQRKHAFAIIAAVGGALAHAHRREVVHADLKPSNVMLTSGGEVRVLEFGFARNRAMELHTASTMHEAPTPSPAYASVERVNGSEPDVSDDVYSLACIAYEVLTGQHPFGGRSALLARAHGRKPPRPVGLTNKQWQGLQRALLWSRGDRRIDVPELLSALECTEAAIAPITPEDVLTPPETSIPWAKMAAWAACLLAAIAVGYYVMPDLLLRKAPESVASTPVQAPPADREQQTGELSVAPTPAPEPEKPGAAKTTARKEVKTAAATSANTNRAPARPPGALAAVAPSGRIEFDKDTYVATEGDGSVRLIVKRDGASRGPLSFTWSLRGNSAEAGADFAAIGPGAEQLASSAGETTLTIPLVSDGVVENTELFLVELHAGDAAALGERSHAAVIIVDDD